MITFQKELFVDIQKELPQIFYSHWLETGTNKEEVFLDPDWGKYNLLQQSGVLHIITIRHNKLLIGYYFGLVQPHLHYSSTISGHTDIFYLAPMYRKGYIGVRLFLEAEKMLRSLSVKRWHVGAVLHSSIYSKKKSLDIEPLLTRLGFSFTEKHFSKMLLE